MSGRTKKDINERRTAYELLMKTELDGAYSGILLDETEHTPFAAALYYGVLERRLTLDYVIRQYSSREFDSLGKDVVTLLRMGIYQLLYMNVPECAAVNETVGLCVPKVRGFVNAVLRSFLRGGKAIDLSGIDELHKLSVEYSCPAWIVKMWLNSYGHDQTECILKASLGRPPVYARVNTLKTTTGELCNHMNKLGFSSEIYAEIENCLKINSAKTGIKNCEAYQKGLFHVQDISSQQYCCLTGVCAGETVIDMCAAPGGKSFTISEIMNNTGRVLSLDLHESRVGLIREGARRLGIDIISARQNDACVFNSDLPKADRVLCDVPCSGLGVIRRKPEIKYKPKSQHDGLPKIQEAILYTAKHYVKDGGHLIYSTCTLRKEENEDIAEAFLAKSPEFEPCGTHTFLPDSGGDGFFMAMFKKSK